MRGFHPPVCQKESVGMFGLAAFADFFVRWLACHVQVLPPTRSFFGPIVCVSALCIPNYPDYLLEKSTDESGLSTITWRRARLHSDHRLFGDVRNPQISNYPTNSCGDSIRGTNSRCDASLPKQRRLFAEKRNCSNRQERESNHQRFCLLAYWSESSGREVSRA